MKVFRVRFYQHYRLKKIHGWCIVIAPDSDTALEFANRDLIKKLGGYAHAIEIKELCTVKEGKCSYVDGDYNHVIDQLAGYYE